MERNTKILVGLGVLGIVGYFIWKNKNKSEAPIVLEESIILEEPKLIDTPKEDTSKQPSVIEWKETQSAGASFMETNLQILVNGEEKVLEFFNNSGSLTVSDGDLINVFVWSAVGSYGSTPWVVSGTNNLIITENGQELVNKSISVQDNMSHTFIVKGGKTYKINNYTMPTN
jgi:hypothetical protein